MRENKLTQGRVNQKLQTRLDILKAAKALMKKNKKISLEDIAVKAGISRATMYRYFSNIDLLITEVSLDFNHKSSDELAEEVKDASLQNKVAHIQQYYNTLALKNETAFRRYISAVLSESIVSKSSLRGARRVDTLTKALLPYKSQFAKGELKKLIHTASLLMGIDPVITCKDVCNLSNKQTKETLEWALQKVLDGIRLNELSP